MSASAAATATRTSSRRRTRPTASCWSWAWNGSTAVSRTFRSCCTPVDRSSTAKVNAEPRPAGVCKRGSLESFPAAWPRERDDGPLANEPLSGADGGLNRLALKASGASDHTCAWPVRGSARELLEPLHAPTGASPSRRAKIVIWRLVLTALTLQRRRDRPVIAAPRPALTSHMEVGRMATDFTNGARATGERVRGR